MGRTGGRQHRSHGTRVSTGRIASRSLVAAAHRTAHHPQPAIRPAGRPAPPRRRARVRMPPVLLVPLAVVPSLGGTSRVTTGALARVTTPARNRGTAKTTGRPLAATAIGPLPTAPIPGPRPAAVTIARDPVHATMMTVMMTNPAGMTTIPGSPRTAIPTTMYGPRPMRDPTRDPMRGPTPMATSTTGNGDPAPGMTRHGRRATASRTMPPQ